MITPEKRAERQCNAHQFLNNRRISCALVFNSQVYLWLPNGLKNVKTLYDDERVPNVKSFWDFCRSQGWEVSNTYITHSPAGS
jgi:hypothetical protein